MAVLAQQQRLDRDLRQLGRPDRCRAPARPAVFGLHRHGIDRAALDPVDARDEAQPL
jgi:hypothetical protein